MFRTSVAERISYGAFPLGSNLVNMLIMNFLNLFYTDKLGLPTAAVALMLFATKIWDGANDLLFGALIDRLPVKKDKFLPWLKMGAFALPVFTVLLFIDIKTGIPVKLVYAYATFILWEMWGTITGIPHSALITALTDDTNERNTLIAFGIFAGIVGTMVTGFLGGPLIKRIGYLPTATLIAIVSFLSMVPVGFTAKERVVHGKKESVTLLELIRTVIKNQNLLAFNVSYFFLLATSFVLTVGVYFVKWNLGDLDLMGLVLISNFTPIAILPLVLPALIKRFGKRALFISGTLTGIILSVVQYFIGYDNLPLFLVLNGIKVLGIYMPVNMSAMFVADCAEYNFSITGKRNEGLNFALGAFTNKVGSAVSGSLAMLLLGFFGYDGNAAAQSESALSGIWMLTSILPAIGLLASLIVFIRFYTLTEKDVQQMIRREELTKEITITNNHGENNND